MAINSVITDDGSYTLYDSDRELYYRSVQGAKIESEYVFLEGTHLFRVLNIWRVLELGLGGGLNFLVTAHAAVAQGIPLEYHVIESRVLSPEKIEILNYEVQFQNSSQPLNLLLKALKSIELSSGPQRFYSEGLTLVIYPCDWSNVLLPETFQADAIYHDPFGPKDNPECWTEACFVWERDALAEKGVIATYAAASHIRKAMARAGLYIAKKKGAGRKREMTLAALSQDVLIPHKRIPREKYL